MPQLKKATQQTLQTSIKAVFDAYLCLDTLNRQRTQQDANVIPKKLSQWIAEKAQAGETTATITIQSTPDTPEKKYNFVITLPPLDHPTTYHVKVTRDPTLEAKAIVPMDLAAYQDTDLLDALCQQPSDKPFTLQKHPGKDKWAFAVPFTIDDQTVLLGGPAKLALYRTHLLTLRNMLHALAQAKNIDKYTVEINNFLVGLATGSGKTFVQALFWLALKHAGLRGIFTFPDNLIPQFQSDLLRLLPKSVVQDVQVLRDTPAAAPEAIMEEDEEDEEDEEAKQENPPPAMTLEKALKDDSKPMVIASCHALFHREYHTLLAQNPDEVILIADEQHHAITEEKQHRQFHEVSKKLLTMPLTATPSESTYQHATTVAQNSPKSKAAAGQGMFPEIVMLPARGLGEKYAYARKHGSSSNIFKRLAVSIGLSFANNFQKPTPSPGLTLLEELAHHTFTKPDNHPTHFSGDDQRQQARWNFQMPAMGKVLVIVSDQEALINMARALNDDDTHLDTYHQGNVAQRKNVYSLFELPDLDQKINHQYQQTRTTALRAELQSQNPSLKHSEFQKHYATPRAQMKSAMMHNVIDLFLCHVTGFNQEKLDQMRFDDLEGLMTLVQKKSRAIGNPQQYFKAQQFIYHEQRNPSGIDAEGAGQLSRMMGALYENNAWEDNNSLTILVDNWRLNTAAIKAIIDPEDQPYDRAGIAPRRSFFPIFDDFFKQHQAIFLKSGTKPSGASDEASPDQPFSQMEEEAELIFDDGKLAPSAKGRALSPLERLDDTSRQYTYSPDRHFFHFSETIADNYFKKGLAARYITDKKGTGFSDLNLETVAIVTTSETDETNNPSNTLQAVGRVRGLGNTTPRAIIAHPQDAKPLFPFAKLPKLDDYFPALFKSQKKFNKKTLKKLGKILAENIIKTMHSHSDLAHEMNDSETFSRLLLEQVAQVLRQINNQNEHDIVLSRKQLHIVLKTAQKEIKKTIDQLEKPLKMSFFIRSLGNFLFGICAIFHFFTHLPGLFKRTFYRPKLKKTNPTYHIIRWQAPADNCPQDISDLLEPSGLIHEGLDTGEDIYIEKTPDGWFIHQLNADNQVERRAIQDQEHITQLDDILDAQRAFDLTDTSEIAQVRRIADALIDSLNAKTRQDPTFYMLIDAPGEAMLARIQQGLQTGAAIYFEYQNTTLNWYIYRLDANNQVKKYNIQDRRNYYSLGVRLDNKKIINVQTNTYEHKEFPLTNPTEVDQVKTIRDASLDSENAAESGDTRTFKDSKVYLKIVRRLKLTKVFRASALLKQAIPLFETQAEVVKQQYEPISDTGEVFKRVQARRIMSINALFKQISAQDNVTLNHQTFSPKLSALLLQYLAGKNLQGMDENEVLLAWRELKGTLKAKGGESKLVLNWLQSLEDTFKATSLATFKAAISKSEPQGDQDQDEDEEAEAAEEPGAKPPETPFNTIASELIKTNQGVLTKALSEALNAFFESAQGEEGANTSFDHIMKTHIEGAMNTVPTSIMHAFKEPCIAHFNQIFAEQLKSAADQLSTLPEALRQMPQGAFEQAINQAASAVETALKNEPENNADAQIIEIFSSTFEKKFKTVMASHQMEIMRAVKPLCLQVFKEKLTKPTAQMQREDGTTLSLLSDQAASKIQEATYQAFEEALDITEQTIESALKEASAEESVNIEQLLQETFKTNFERILKGKLSEIQKKHEAETLQTIQANCQQVFATTLTQEINTCSGVCSFLPLRNSTCENVINTAFTSALQETIEKITQPEDNSSEPVDPQVLFERLFQEKTEAGIQGSRLSALYWATLNNQQEPAVQEAIKNAATTALEPITQQAKTAYQAYQANVTSASEAAFNATQAVTGALQTATETSTRQALKTMEEAVGKVQRAIALQISHITPALTAGKEAVFSKKKGNDTPQASTSFVDMSQEGAEKVQNIITSFLQLTPTSIAGKESLFPEKKDNDTPQASTSFSELDQALASHIMDMGKRIKPLLTCPAFRNNLIYLIGFLSEDDIARILKARETVGEDQDQRADASQVHRFIHLLKKNRIDTIEQEFLVCTGLDQHDEPVIPFKNVFYALEPIIKEVVFSCFDFNQCNEKGNVTFYNSDVYLSRDAELEKHVRKGMPKSPDAASHDEESILPTSLRKFSKGMSELHYHFNTFFRRFSRKIFFLYALVTSSKATNQLSQVESKQQLDMLKRINQHLLKPLEKTVKPRNWIQRLFTRYRPKLSTKQTEIDQADRTLTARDALVSAAFGEAISELKPLNAEQVAKPETKQDTIAELEAASKKKHKQVTQQAGKQIAHHRAKYLARRSVLIGYAVFTGITLLLTSIAGMAISFTTFSTFAVLITEQFAWNIASIWLIQLSFPALIGVNIAIGCVAGLALVGTVILLHQLVKAIVQCCTSKTPPPEPLSAQSYAMTPQFEPKAADALKQPSPAESPLPPSSPENPDRSPDKTETKTQDQGKT